MFLYSESKSVVQIAPFVLYQCKITPIEAKTMLMTDENHPLEAKLQDLNEFISNTNYVR